jgi:hypothetical protein
MMPHVELFAFVDDSEATVIGSLIAKVLAYPINLRMVGDSEIIRKPVSRKLALQLLASTQRLCGSTTVLE